jgi:hypothetical protein
MRLIKPVLVALVGWGFIAAVLYVCVCLTAFAVVVFLQRPVNIFPLNHYQSLHYFMGGRNIWQYDPACAQADLELIYVPREGACRFRNMEFDTTLNFDARGRVVPARELADPMLPGIAVLGDSYGMGWGVEDEETFANVMQARLMNPVFNLGVSSYGTERELKRLALSGLIDQTDTIIILYSINDIGENVNLRTPDDYALAATRFADEARVGEGIASYGNSVAYVKELLREVLLLPIVVPLQNVKAYLRRYLDESRTSGAGLSGATDFLPHLVPLRDVLLRYQNLLEGKQVYIAYVIPRGERFNNYPAGPDSELPQVSFLEPPLAEKDFYLLDDHLTARGHLHLGEWLLAALQQEQSRQLIFRPNAGP